MKFHSGWPSVERVPALVLVDAHDPVAEVVVAADHVRVRVVELVVRVLPQVGRRGVVPLPGGRVDLRVAHPVPLAVHDVVADLHVLEDLRDGQAGGADEPRGREQREEQDGAAGQLELALDVDDAADVGGVALAAAGEAPARGWRRARGRGPRCPRRSGARWGRGLLLDGGHGGSFSEFDVAGAGGGGDAGLDEHAVAGDAVVSVAVAQVADGALAQRRDAAEADAHPAARRHEHAGAPRRRRAAAWRRRRRRSTSLELNVTVPPSPVTTTVGRKRSVCRRSAIPRSAQCPSSASSIPVGPQAQVSRSSQVGRRARSSSSASSIPSVSVCRSTRREAPARREQAQLAAEDDVGGGRRASARRRRRPARRSALRSIPITGVMPLPAVTNRTFAGRGVGQDEVAARLVELDERPGAGAPHQVVADLAVGDRLDGDRDAAVGAVDRRGQRVRAPLADAVDVDADPDVLARDVPGPAASWPDHERDGVAGLGVDLDDPPAQVGAGAQRARPGRGSRPAAAASS